MASKITQEQIIQKDIWDNAIKSTKELISQVDLLDVELKKTAATSKQILKNSSGKPTFNGLKEEREAEEKLNVLYKQNLALSKEKIKLAEQLKAAKIRQTKASKILTQAEADEREKIRLLNLEKRQQAKVNTTVTGTIARTRAELGKVTKAWAELTKVEGKNSAATKQLGIEKERLSSKLKKLEKATGDSRRNVGNYGSAIDGLKTSFKNLAGQIGLTFGVLGAVRVFKDSIDKVRQFELQNAKLAGVLGRTRAEIQALTASQIEYGTSTVFTAKQVGELQESFARLGFTESEILGVTKATLDLATALQVGLSESATLVGSTLNAFGLTSADTEDVVNTLTRATQKSSLDFQKLSDSLAFVAPTAKTLGLSLEETTGILGVLTDNGIKASRSGRLLSSSFLKLAEQGKTLEEGLNEITEAQLAGKSALEVAAVASKVFGKESATLGIILADNRDKVKELTLEIIDNGEAAQKLAEEQLKTLDGSLKLLTSAWDGYILKLNDASRGGSRLSKVIRFLAENLETIINTLVASVVAVGSLTEAFKILNPELTFNEKLQEKINTTNEISTKVIKEHTEKLEDLIKVAQDETKTKEERLKAIEDINAISPKYLGGIDLETVSTLEGAAALKEYVKQLDKQTKAKATKIRLDQIQEQLDAEALKKGKDFIKDATLLDKAKAGAKKGASFGFYNTEADLLKAGVRNSVEKKRLLKAEREQLLKEQSTVLKAEVENVEKSIEVAKEGSNKKIEIYKRESKVKKQILEDDGKAEADLLKKQLEAEIQAKKDAEFNLKNDLDETEDDETEALVDADTDALKETLDKKAQLEIDNRQKTLATLEALNNKFFNDKKSKLDKEITDAEEREQSLQDLANNGNKEAAESLASSQKQQADANKKKEELLKKEKAFETALAIIQSYNTALDGGASNGEALAEAITSVTVLTSLAGSLPSFYDGTEDTGTVANPLDGNGGRTALLHDNERVVDKKNNKKFGGVSNDTAADIVQAYNNNLLTDVTDVNTPHLSLKETRYESNEAILKKFESLEKSVVSAINNKESYLGSDVDTVKNILKQYYEKSGTKTTINSKSKIW